MFCAAVPREVPCSRHGRLHTTRRGACKDTIFERTDVTQVETLLPDENFMHWFETLGFNRKNAIVSLMPLLTYISEKTV